MPSIHRDKLNKAEQDISGNHELTKLNNSQMFDSSSYKLECIPQGIHQRQKKGQILVQGLNYLE